MGVYILSESKYWNSLKSAIIEAFGVKPDKVDSRFTIRTEFYRHQLTTKVKGLFKVKCPDTWDKDYLLTNLILEGKVCITDTKMGVVALRCAPHGYNVYDRPCDVTIANPVLGTMKRKIGVDCELIYLLDNKNFRSLSQLINIYAAKLAMCDSSIDTNLMNTKLAYLIDCVDKKQADEAKAIYDKISQGEPAVFYTSESKIVDGGKKLQFFTTHVKEQYIVDKIQDEKRTIMNEFLTEIGINNVNTEKKERLITDEANANNDELEVNMSYAYDNIIECVERVKKMFTELELEIRIPLYDKVRQSNSEERGVAHESDGHTGDMVTEE